MLQRRPLYPSFVRNEPTASSDASPSEFRMPSFPDFGRGGSFVCLSLNGPTQTQNWLCQLQLCRVSCNQRIAARAGTAALDGLRWNRASKHMHCITHYVPVSSLRSRLLTAPYIQRTRRCTNARSMYADSTHYFERQELVVRPRCKHRVALSARRSTPSWPINGLMRFHLCARANAHTSRQRSHCREAIVQIPPFVGPMLQFKRYLHSVLALYSPRSHVDYRV